MIIDAIDGGPRKSTRIGIHLLALKDLRSKQPKAVEKLIKGTSCSVASTADSHSLKYALQMSTK
jgi:hypothetical protein